MRNSFYLLLIALPAFLPAQTQSDSATSINATMGEILRRLEHLEQQNTELRNEVRDLRSELDRRQANAAPAPPVAAAETSPSSLEDRVAVVERRVDEQAQTKVEAAHRLPIQFTGMLLFNAFANSNTSATDERYAGLITGPDRDGATVGQTLLGLRFDGPELPGGGQVHGSLDMDFLGGLTSGTAGDPYAYSLRIRRAVVSFDWADRYLTVGQDKPLISQRQPDSLAEVAIPPLSDAGNLWYWQPQIRFGERFHFTADTGMEAAAALIETYETAAASNPGIYSSIDPARPALEGRVALWHRWGSDRRVEIGPGFHLSTTHIGGYSIPSRFASVDWLVRPVSWFEWTGLTFGGENMANLGGFNTGFTFTPGYAPSIVRGLGGWSQISFRITPRLRFNAFGGLQAPETYELNAGSISHVAAFAANVSFRATSNVLFGLEALQQRTGFTNYQRAIENHYDLAIGYLF